VPEIKIRHGSGRYAAWRGKKAKGKSVTGIQIVPGKEKRTMPVQGALHFCTNSDGCQ
jgi:hypothetical protein